VRLLVLVPAIILHVSLTSAIGQMQASRGTEFVLPAARMGRPVPIDSLKVNVATGGIYWALGPVYDNETYRSMFFELKTPGHPVARLAVDADGSCTFADHRSATA